MNFKQHYLRTQDNKVISYFEGHRLADMQFSEPFNIIRADIDEQVAKTRCSSSLHVN